MIGLSVENYFNNSSDELVMFIKVVLNNDLSETSDKSSKCDFSDIKECPPKSKEVSCVQPVVSDILSD